MMKVVVRTALALVGLGLSVSTQLFAQSVSRGTIPNCPDRVSDRHGLCMELLGDVRRPACYSHGERRSIGSTSCPQNNPPVRDPATIRPPVTDPAMGRRPDPTGRSSKADSGSTTKSVPPRPGDGDDGGGGGSGDGGETGPVGGDADGDDSIPAGGDVPRRARGAH